MNTSNFTTSWSESKFWSKVAIQESRDKCWPWIGAISGGKYGRLTIKRMSYSAHRIAYTLTHGAIPKGMDICHKCDNPPCCNPDHLFAGTRKDNFDDAVKKGRISPLYATSRITKLTESDVREVLFLLKVGGKTQSEIANLFGVNQSEISRMKNKKRWKHVLSS
jgi:HNH endonuclease